MQDAKDACQKSSPIASQAGADLAGLPPAPLTPAQFAARYGRSGTWGYRMIYAGRVRILPNVRFLIPHSEVLKFEANTEIYLGRSASRKRRLPKPKDPTSAARCRSGGGKENE